MRERSLSRASIVEALHIAETHDAQTQLLDLRALNLPMYVPDFGIDDYPSEHRASIRTLLDVSHRADAMVWASPCYHGTVSGIFKNALDYIELLSEATPAYLNGKAVGLITINDSKTFSAMSNSVHELQAWLAPTHIQLGKGDFDATLHFSTDRATRRVTRLVSELLEFTNR